MRKVKLNQLIILLIMTILIGVLVAGCGSSKKSSGTTGNATEKKTGGFKIALSNGYFGNSWRSQMLNTAEAYFKKRKAAGDISEYYISSSGTDPQAQINEIRNMISQGYDAIVIESTSPTALIPVVKEAVDRGIIVTTFEDIVNSPEAYKVIVDLEEQGAKRAQFLMDKIGGKGNILVIEGLEGVYATMERDKGQQKVLDKYPDVKVLKKGYGKWDDATTAVLMNDMLSAFKGTQIDGILNEGCNENAVIKALKQHGLDPTKIAMTGDMQNGYFRFMVEEGVDGYGAGDPPLMVCPAIDIAIRVLKGETVDKLTKLEIPVITKENAKKYYIPEAPDNFFSYYTDEKNTWDLTLEECLPKK